MSALRDEASVEDFFVSRWLKDLGYEDGEIRPKESLSEIVVARGRKREQYKPDYAIVCGGIPRWIIEVKGPEEDVDKWTYQGAGYALGLNREFKDENPCQYYVITNGVIFKVFKWDEGDPIYEIGFSEFVEDHPNFLALLGLFDPKIVREGWAAPSSTKPDVVVLKKPTIEEVKRAFKSCHQTIWKTEKMNPQPAFFEFVKIMFVKLWEDRKIHEDAALGELVKLGKPIPKSRLVFSKHWIDSRVEDGIENPIDTILFRKLSGSLREAVARGKKKPIFENDEKIEIQPGTIRQVVSKLELYDMFSIDEDLNGRLFETFLSATMRGQALGQYFTPRSVAKLMTRLAAPRANRGKVDTVLDACCGTGGFLIEALTDMRNEIRGNTSLTTTEATKLLEEVANNSIYGIDAGREPPVARIARINMYLHGDGGSRIYAADSLDKSVLTGVEHDQRSRLELEELQDFLRGIVKDREKGFDIVLSNPPFSMGYSSTLENEKEILDQYALTTFGHEDTKNHRASLTSNIMFIERYADLLKDGGKLLTVIDDSVLSGKKFAFARDYIRKHFIIRAVISLPGDAFQRVGARAKTSILYLTRRAEGEEGQPGVFMAECQYVGLDDVPMKTRPSQAVIAREKAEREMSEIVLAFKDFLAGQKGPWLVPAARVTGRLDVKACLPRDSDVSDEWVQNGLEVIALKDIVEPITEGGFNPQECPEEKFTLLRVRYDGIPEEGEAVLGKELTYNHVQRAKVGDIVISNIAVTLGSTCVIPDYLEHTIVSSEFTIMRVKDTRFHPWYLWGLLRSAEARARLLSEASGTNRLRVQWPTLQEIPVPLVAKDAQEEIGEQYRQSVTAVAEAERSRVEASRRLNSMLNLENPWAVQRLKAAKPPK
jgi:type I restriction enzyme M protein